MSFASASLFLLIPDFQDVQDFLDIFCLDEFRFIIFWLRYPFILCHLQCLKFSLPYFELLVQLTSESFVWYFEFFNFCFSQCGFPLVILFLLYCLELFSLCFFVFSWSSLKKSICHNCHFEVLVLCFHLNCISQGLLS